MAKHVAHEESEAAKVLGELATRVESDKVDEFTLSRLEKLAASSKDSDWINYIYVMGAISAIRDDVDAVRKYYTQALDVEGNTFKTRFNFAQSLAMVGKFAESYVQAKAAETISPTSEHITGLMENISSKMLDEMWEDMKEDTEEDLTRMCMMNFAAGEK
ncbi:hypothetical protein SAMN05421830_11342 [Desulfomicrobium norvegicum]|uniref:Tetratricopeptide repeat-containing protein n=1 Tax=Desulfomicrobium norvegicum (strain DSM 1741 / NCIMB 8310) TaxID=52561 RepID=A0A8G2C5W1_DESNO|nr:hypothetical protein [Desulfomicrobium norvegicum]SFM07105.1 hypothetical protein SAMN05421830_11342 [Desulfomicrobium norvegicum]